MTKMMWAAIAAAVLVGEATGFFGGAPSALGRRPSAAARVARQPLLEPLRAVKKGGKRQRKAPAPEEAATEEAAPVAAEPEAPVLAKAAKAAKSAGFSVIRPPTQEEIRAQKYGALDTSGIVTPTAAKVAKADKKRIKEAGGDLRLPDLQDLAKQSKDRDDERMPAEDYKIPRGDLELLRRAIEADPNADMNPNLYKDERTRVDAVSNFLGENADKFFSIESAYIQLGHAVLAPTTLLFAVVHDPGLPLTDLPQAYRDFFIQGLAVIYSINVAVAAFAFFEAKKRQQPAAFWAAKSFFLGGIALNQLRTSTETGKKAPKGAKRKYKNKPFPERGS